MLVDTHAHLNDKNLYGDIDGVLARAKEAGVGIIVNIGFDWQASLMSLRLADKYPQIYATAGVHPHYAKGYSDEVEEKIYGIAKEQKLVAIGEIGLDYYRNLSPKDQQQEAFRRQIKLAKELKMPIVIHDRDAHEDCLKIIRQEKAGENGGIFHCFSGSWEMAKICLNLGFLISFAGPLTYHNARNLWEVGKNAPSDHILVETDSPYLSPDPYRGKTNEPARVVLVAEKLAQLRNVSYEEIAALTTENACRIYGITYPNQN